jgi:hypothetical protein
MGGWGDGEKIPNSIPLAFSTPVVRCRLSKLEFIGIFKTHIKVFVDNDLGNEYWQRRGWVRRDDIDRSSDPNV